MATRLNVKNTVVVRQGHSLLVTFENDARMTTVLMSLHMAEGLITQLQRQLELGDYVRPTRVPRAGL